MCKDSCKFTFTSLVEVVMCVEEVCVEGEKEEENEPEDSSEVAGKRPSSACKAMCRAKYFSIQARLDCMDTKCTGMYRSWVGRIKRDLLLTGNTQLTCSTMCDQIHSKLEDKIRCIKSFDCRGMLRNHIGRFAAKRSTGDKAKLSGRERITKHTEAKELQ